jgi:uncharacterized Zn-finger protein
MQKFAHKKAVAPIEVIETDTPQFHCDGGKGGLGHPRVFLTINNQGHVDCPYCGRHFQLAKGASASAHH